MSIISTRAMIPGGEDETIAKDDRSALGPVPTTLAGNIHLFLFETFFTTLLFETSILKQEPSAVL